MKWKPGKLAKDTSILTLGMGLRAFSQGLVFIIIARNLGAKGYGEFVALVALTAMLSGFVGFGSHVLLTRDIALDHKNFKNSWGYALFSILLSFPFIFVLFFGMSYLIFLGKIAWQVVTLIGVSELLFWPLSRICISTYQGMERMSRASHIMLVPSIARLVAATILLLLLPSIDKNNWLIAWAGLYFVAAMATVLYTQIRVYIDLGAPIFVNSLNIKKMTSRIKEGLPFSLWGGADTLYVDADKIMLTQMISTEITGIYSAAYRVISIFLIPIYGLINATTPRFFIEGNKGIQGSFNYTFKIIKLPILYAFLVSFIIYISASFLPYILGLKYKESVSALYLLAFIPITMLLRIFIQHILATSGLQKLGVYMLIFGVIINISCNLLLIPVFSWKGAIISTYISEIAMTISTILIIFYKLNTKYKLAIQEK